MGGSDALASSAKGGDSKMHAHQSPHHSATSCLKAGIEVQ